MRTVILGPERFRGGAVVRAFQDAGHDVKFVVQPHSPEEATASECEILALDPDVVLWRAWYPTGASGERRHALALNRALCRQGLYVSESDSVVEGATSKIETARALAKTAIGHHVLPTTIFEKGVSISEAELRRSFDKLQNRGLVVIKTNHGNKGVGVNIASWEGEPHTITDQRAGRVVTVQSILSEAGKAGMVMQKFVDTGETPWHIRAYVIDGEFVCAIRKDGELGEFISNGKDGEHYSSEEAKTTAEFAAKALGVFFAGVDLVQVSADSNDRPLFAVLEVNTTPGIGGVYRADSRARQANLAKNRASAPQIEKGSVPSVPEQRSRETSDKTGSTPPAKTNAASMLLERLVDATAQNAAEHATGR